MCTLVFAWRVFDGFPIVAAANRDEALGRPSRPPALLDSEVGIVAPRDERAGGTWIGYNEAGTFVAVTNRDAEIEGDRSRGLLVRDALARSTAKDALAFVREELAEREYAGFNLVVADSSEAILLEWDGVLRTTHFDPGVHVVVNEGHDRASRKATAIRNAVRPALGTDAETWFDHAREVLRDHDVDACVHGDGYGTRSSSLIAIPESGEARYWFADGKPCETDYEVVETDNQI